MARSLTAKDRSALIRLASSLPVGSPQRKAILSGLAKTSFTPDPVNRSKASSSGKVAQFSKEKLADAIAQTLMRTSKGLKVSEVKTEFGDFKTERYEQRVKDSDSYDYEDIEYRVDLPHSYSGEVTFSIPSDLLPPYDSEADDFDSGPILKLIEGLSREVSQRIDLYDLIAGIEESPPIDGRGFSELEERVNKSYELDAYNVEGPSEPFEVVLGEAGGMRFAKFELQVLDSDPKQFEVWAQFEVVGDVVQGLSDFLEFEYVPNADRGFQD
jgi:hypothetical protein